MNKRLRYSLSSDEVKKLAPNSKFVLYEDVHKYNNIDELLAPYDSIILLYEWIRKPHIISGHYVTLNRLPDGQIEMFDSFGTKPDESLKELEEVPDAFKRMTNQDHKYLLHLLIDSPYKTSFNEYKLQNPAYSTCGRWCALRVNYKGLTLKQFVDMFLNKRESPDVIAVHMTGY